MKDVRKRILILSVCCWTVQSFAQDLVIDELKDSKWTCETIINDFNIGGLKGIELSKLKVPIESLKTDLTIWTFTDREIWIQRYEPEKGLSQSIVKCAYKYDTEQKRLKLFHFSQDSTVWDFSITMVSSGNYVLMTRR